MTQTSQLTLSIQLPDDETFDSYQSDTNDAELRLLSGFIAQQQLLTSVIHGFYLFGGRGVGKSHLLHASCVYANQLNMTAVCLSFSEYENLSVDMLDGLEAIDVVCLDDIHLVLHDAQWQRAIFDLYNRIIEQNKRLILSGDRAVVELSVSLPDLASRLSWGYVAQLKPLSDEEKLIAIQYRAQQRGLLIGDDVARFMMARLDRDMTSLIKALDLLDKESIREQRRITIPFIKEVLLTNQD
ncbi:DnaA regulatory inactivator Hda [Thalassotalea marina]|uniref:DnaA regulatory inactivator Hda n=1 Tax=Thalassotalea marina TaxID=1673741 RepID=A0A919BNG7_9GAMM|nr:DnaA regulatory inactivator Hda [Thalassotalea marina]GHG02180.1 DnaA regulatory inactivator Hda [Thalassotalea marina]